MSYSGLQTTQPGWEEKLKAKEHNWVDNHQKYNVLTESGKPPKKSSHKDRESRSRSPNRHSRSHQSEHSNFNKKDDEHAVIRRSARCFDEGVSKEHLIVLGMYRLSPEQEQIYNSFVNMISEFDQFDMVRCAC